MPPATPSFKPPSPPWAPSPPFAPPAPLSPSPSAPIPSLPPGATYKHVLSLTILLAADANTFDGSEYAGRVAGILNGGLDVQSSEVKINIPLPMPAYGLRVAAAIDFESPDNADVALKMLTRLSRAALSERLGVTIVRVEELTVDILVRAAPSPPPPPAPLAPTQAPPPPAPTVSVFFFAPKHVSSHVLSNVHALETVFSVALDIPSSWLDIALAQDQTMDVKAPSGHELYAIVIEITPQHFSNELLATIRSMIGDEERLQQLLTDAVCKQILSSLGGESLADAYERMKPSFN